MKKVTPRTLPAVWLKLTAYVAEVAEQRDGHTAGGPAASFCDDLNSFLDQLLADDAFGTEGQNDPRGDHRS